MRRFSIYAQLGCASVCACSLFVGASDVLLAQQPPKPATTTTSVPPAPQPPKPAATTTSVPPAQQPPKPAATTTSLPPGSAPAGRPAAPPAAMPAPPPDYVVGPDDVLTIVFWREKDMSGDVAVRPDGKISLPLLNEVQAAGLTPDQLREALTTAAGKYIEDPNVTVQVKTINSRRVFITGEVAKPGPYPLMAPTTVLQLLAMAGGVLEYADSKNILIMRTENGRPMSYRFNYKEVMKRRNLKQNIELKPGDTIIVP